MYGHERPQDEPIGTWEPAITPTLDGADGTGPTFTADDVRDWVHAQPRNGLLLPSRSILTCYNSAREKIGKLKTPLAPAILAREGHFVYDQKRNLRWCCPRLARGLTENPRV
jgi:hypothetical protein